MGKEFTYKDIIWVKNVTDHNINRAYWNVGKEFLLHFPDHVGNNRNAPHFNQIILLRQTTDRGREFTHLVSPINDEDEFEGIIPRYRYGRKVQVIAKTPPVGPILVHNTTFGHLWTRGNVCSIENIHGAGGYEQLQKDIWEAFSPYLVNPRARKTQ